MNWQETTLRKGTKTPKICRDMFIADSRGRLCFCEVKNGRQTKRQHIDNIFLASLVKDHGLVRRSSGVFANCSVYRTPNSWDIIDIALAG